MCAIFGITGSYDEQRARQALQLMQHRGPDQTTVVTTERLFLGHNRLKIVDPHSTLRQPMQKKDIYAVFNGEIYNYKALKAELTEYQFESDGDSEVVLAAYLRWGESFVARLEGMFAIAIIEEDRVLLFRDRQGEKPLYYFYDQNHTVFASELKAIVDYRENTAVDPLAVQSCLMMQTTLAPQTMYKDLFAVEPGMMLVLQQGRVESSYFADILPERFVEDDEPTVLVSIEEKLKESIRKRQDTEVPRGFLLSGGVDSSLIAAMAQCEESSAIDTFALGYDEFERYDERPYAKEVAAYIGSNHHEIVFGFSDFKESLYKSLTTLDEPINDPAALPLYHLFKVLGKDYGKKVILSGEGSDELFMGYRPYVELLDIEKLGELGKKSWLKNYFGAHYSPHREWEWYRRVWSEELLFRGSSESFTKRHLQSLLADSKAISDSADLVLPLYERYKKHTEAYGVANWKLWYRYVDLKVHQGDYFLKKLDRVSMAHAIEARAPFMQQDLIAYVLSVNPDFFLKEGRTKNLIKDIALKYLPSTIVERKKRGFSYPFIEWMDRLDAWSEMQSVNGKIKLFDPKALDVLIAGGKKGKFKQHLFGVYYLLLWLEIHA